MILAIIAWILLYALGAVIFWTLGAINAKRRIRNRVIKGYRNGEFR
jgi:hypothetical protein